MVTVLGIGGTYVEAGATCFDAVEGDISARVQVVGARAVDTLHPTRFNFPYVVSYHCTNEAGSRAVVAMRYVYVTCPVGENLWKDANGDTFCSVL